MTRLLGTALALALFCAAMWLAWLGWDHEYYLVDGVPQGPYRAWQVIGCGATIAAGAVLAWWFVRRWVAVAVLTPAAVLGIAIPWSVDAARTDDSGLWVVGLILLLIGGSIGIGTLLTVTAAIGTSVRHR